MSEYKVGQIVRITETNKYMASECRYGGSYDLGDLVVVEDTGPRFFRGDEDCLGPWIDNDYAEPTGFSVGDVVVAKEDAPYWYTTNGWEGVIEGVFRGNITVKDLDDDLIYTANHEYFYKKEEVEPSEDSHAEPTGFSVGDVVVAKEDTPYFITTNGWEGVIKGVSRYSIVVGKPDDDRNYTVIPKFFYKKEEVRTTPETPRTFGELSDEEKGALLLADHEGKPIQFYYIDEWIDTDFLSWCPALSYRVFTPELEQEEKQKRISDLKEKISYLRKNEVLFLDEVEIF
jgi:uncharacterized protein YodC (DUF2158 family)